MIAITSNRTTSTASGGDETISTSLLAPPERGGDHEYPYAADLHAPQAFIAASEQLECAEHPRVGTSVDQVPVRQL